MRRRVVISGIGCVSPLGLGWDALADGLRGSKTAIQDITLFDPEPYGCRHAAEIVAFDVDTFLETPKAYLDRTSELAFAAMKLARGAAGLEGPDPTPERTGLNVGSAYGSLDTMATFFDDFLKKGPRLVKPVLFPHTYSNTAISLLAIEYGLSGHHLAFASGALSSAMALVDAFDRIRAGELDLVYAGGADSFNETLHAGLDQAGFLARSDGGPAAWTPFDRRRTGFVPGEGAAIVVLEEIEHARRRGAPVIAELFGAGAAGGIRQAMTQALDAEAYDGDADVVVLASANGSVARDAEEAAAIREWAAPLSAPPPVSSVKALTGETLGAGGALQVAAAAVMLKHGEAPSFAEGLEPEQEGGLDLVRGAPRRIAMRRVMANSVDEGGGGVSLCLASPPTQ